MSKWNEFIDLSKKCQKHLIGRSYLHKHNLCSIAHHSSAIEGSKLTIKESWQLLEHKVFPSNAPYKEESIFMVIDHYNALLYVLEQAKKNLSICLPLLEKINSLVKKRTGEEGFCPLTGEKYNTASGELRTYFVGIGLIGGGQKVFMHPKAVPDQTNILLGDINSILENSNDVKSANLLAFEAHYKLVSIHPFGDGNGRTSRLLMNYIQAYHNLPMTFVLNEEKDAYFEALEKTDKTKDLNYFYDFMIDSSIKSMGLMNEYIEKTDNQREIKPKNPSIQKTSIK